MLVDVDGTLLDKNGAISAENEKVIARVLSSGTRVSLSTGRAMTACVPIIKQLSLDGYHIFFDGAMVSNPENGEEVYAKPIRADLARQMIEFVRDTVVNIDFYSSTRYFVERESWATDIRRKFFHLEPTVVDISGLWQTERIIKGTMLVRSAEEKAGADRIYHHFKDKLSFSWTTTPAYPDVDFINVIDPEVSKGRALEALASFLGIALAEVMAIGDGTNDISLLTKVGLAVAMGNAPDEVKKAADHVTLDVDHSGVAAAVERFLL